MYKALFSPDFNYKGQGKEGKKNYTYTTTHLKQRIDYSSRDYWKHVHKMLSLTNEMNTKAKELATPNYTKGPKPKILDHPEVEKIGATHILDFLKKHMLGKELGQHSDENRLDD